ncbi:hypothetical protein ELS82_21980 [Vibrio ouci]|uniref:Uncharacterized protein n=1 Tax=Vibrio ouci TaxID=2499078 RepID=A0A4Y8WA40_9VIBR|nr:hypothetical protein ELS82_21980 [Vibrio ouci]
MVGRDTLHELDQPLKKLAYVSNHWGPLLISTRHICLLYLFFKTCQICLVKLPMNWLIMASS